MIKMFITFQDKDYQHANAQDDIVEGDLMIHLQSWDGYIVTLHEWDDIDQAYDLMRNCGYTHYKPVTHK